MVCDNCINEQRIIELEKCAEINRTQHQKFFDRHESIAVTEGETRVRYEAILNTMAEIKADIAILKDKPTKKYDTIITAIIVAIVSAIIGYFIKGA